MLQGMSEIDQKNYLYDQSDKTTCPLCKVTFVNLKSHLPHCIRKHFETNATGDSEETSCKDVDKEQITKKIPRDTGTVRNYPVSEPQTHSPRPGKRESISHIVIDSQKYIDSLLVKWPQEKKDSELKALQAKLQQTSLPKTERDETAETMNKFTDALRDYLNDNFHVKLDWEKLNSGSYYEQTKVSCFIDKIFVYIYVLV